MIDAIDLQTNIEDRSRVPYLAEWFGLWAIEPERGMRLAQVLMATDIRAHLVEMKAAENSRSEKLAERRNPEAAGSGPEVNRTKLSYLVGMSDGIAVVQVAGTLMKHEMSMEESTSTVMLRRTLRALRMDDAIKGVMLVIDSPGGTAAGTMELGSDVAALAAVKPTWAFIEDLGASAAYWTASQASRIVANAPAFVGSIGTLAVVHDYSAAAAQMGVKVHVVSTGEYKGAGTPGTEILPKHLAEWQRLVDATNEHFLAAVSKGRRMSRESLAKIADGRVHPAAEALKLGLIDGVQTFDAAMDAMAKAVGKQQNTIAGGRSAGTAPHADAGLEGSPGCASGAQSAPTGPHCDGGAAPTGAEMETDMAAENTQTPSPGGSQTGAAAEKPKAATIAELRAAYADDPTYALEAAEKGLTLEQAEAGYAKVLRARLAQQGQQQGQGGQQTKPAGAKPLGGKAARVDADAGDGEHGDDAVAMFSSAVREQMKANGGDRPKAVIAAAKRNPELHRQYLEATNPGRKTRAMIADKYEA